MKTSPRIAIVESKVVVPVSLLENHVNNKHHPLEADVNNYPEYNKVFSDSFENIYWCTEEVEVDGSIEIHLTGPTYRHLCFSIPVTAAFLVVCTKGTGPCYKMTWNCSLS